MYAQSTEGSAKARPAPTGRSLNAPLAGATVMAVCTLAGLIATLPVWPGLKTLLVCAHVFGVTIGFGAVLVIDAAVALLLQRRSISEGHLELIEFASALAALGLTVLWISGLGLLAFYYVKDPGALLNPKLHAKIVVVVILTLNGALVHRIVLPALGRSLGRRLFADMARARVAGCLAVGAVSSVSWFTPFFLGLFREFNFALTMPELLLLYATAVATALLLLLSLFGLFAGSGRPHEATCRARPPRT
jgi:hypothetical protein